MIVKFKVNESWHMFDEVDSLEYRCLRYDEPPVESEYALNYIAPGYSPIGETDSEEAANRRQVVELWLMNKNQLAPSQVFTYHPVYLMNNEGRTIETI